MPTPTPRSTGPGLRAALLADLAVLRASTARLVSTAAALDDAGAAAPSLLPGWTRGHVLTHLARNADGMVLLVGWARDGRPRSMYPSAESRSADIEAGALRPASVLHDDVVASASRLAEALVALAGAGPAVLDAAWGRPLVLGAPRPGASTLPGSALVRARRREVELHHADLGAGYVPADWPTGVADEILRDVAAARLARGGLAGVGSVRSPRESVRLDPDGTGTVLVGPACDLAWWVAGRRPAVALATDGGAPAPAPVPW